MAALASEADFLAGDLAEALLAAVRSGWVLVGLALNSAAGL
jgi:hypothetical protein